MRQGGERDSRVVAPHYIQPIAVDGRRAGSVTIVRVFFVCRRVEPLFPERRAAVGSERLHNLLAAHGVGRRDEQARIPDDGRTMPHAGQRLLP